VTVSAEPPNVTSVALNAMNVFEVHEHEYAYFTVEVPAAIRFVKVVVVPSQGDPDLYLSFDNPLPTGANYTFMQDSVGVDEFSIGRYNHLFCGAAAKDAACTLYLSVLGFDERTVFNLLVYGVEEDYFATGGVGEARLLCAPGCEWTSIGNGECNPQCASADCLFDRNDCAGGATGCSPDCKPEWIGDRYCDEACFNAACEWDHRDCLRPGETPCADHCIPSSFNDRECDAACNVESCGFDGPDCFHDHDECYQRKDGADYRGQVATTESGVQCQAWSEQMPQQHTHTHANWPRSGLGGHHFCRNPDGGDRPWCFTVDAQTRWEYCQVGPPSEVSCYFPPPPLPPLPAPRPPPPPPPPPPTPPPATPPPVPCPSECAELWGNGVCDAPCNVTTCLWDRGDCREIVAGLLEEGKLSLSLFDRKPRHPRRRAAPPLRATSLHPATTPNCPPPPPPPPPRCCAQALLSAS